ncbi:hypothetical protein PGTUg99_005667 [Puccinia graminis f. sp. tritici]|uniref:Secreted protein n=1 Tax=Puccinia graminis f. sp. tritici TaxID=56615 RepID=A0A5B0LQA4_PUCGR|nr:hypothetical protein PGTUg99_005667 [Puccinia graminis f. sp. tritici]
MWAIGLYSSLVILLIGTFKLAGSTPAHLRIPSGDYKCLVAPPQIRQQCCFNGHYTSAGKYVGLETRQQPTGSMSRMLTMTLRSPKRHFIKDCYFYFI